MTGQFTLSNFVVGFGLGFALLWLSQRVMGRSIYFRKVPQIINFIGFFIWELILANLRVAYDVVTPRHYMRPGVVAIPLDVTSDAEIVLLANLITLTPGTLSLDISDDRHTLYVHAMHIDDLEQFRRDIKEGFERRVQEVFA
ncbi:MAG: Na+/H+ antiporter subunit E [Anaerolineae bacterium]|nr:Na+/H+ antiporter subunit E [Anaerolineae bacterium]